MNSPLNIDVDYIVQEVVRRLTDARVGEVKIVDGAERPDSAETVDKGQLALSERVITLEVLRGRLNGVRAVIVPDRAIVTPAVVDELKSQKIELRRAGGQNKACNAELMLLLDAALDIDHGVSQSLSKRGVKVTRQTLSLAELARRIPSLMRHRIPIVVGSPHPAAVVCAANRHAGVRAMAAFGMGCVATMDGLGANVVVIDLPKWNSEKLSDFLAAVAQRGWRECPESWRGLLI